jgi:hypothetical protein
VTIVDDARKEEEWKKLGEHIARKQEADRIKKAQDEFVGVLNQNIGDVKGKPKEGKLPQYIQKFSKPDCNLLAEAVIVGDLPYFAIARTTDKVNEVNITLDPSIIIGNTEYKPFDLDAYLNKPYIFKSSEEFDDTIEAAKKETLRYTKG